jgi:micrococcal nuclease
MDRDSQWDRLALIPLAELEALRRKLAVEFRRRLVTLDTLETHKTTLDQEGATEHSLRVQRALAYRLSDLDRQASSEARLLGLVIKQQRLVERLIWARESALRWQALRAAAPAVELTWEDLTNAAEEIAVDEARLDALLRIMGVPEEEWPQPVAPSMPATPPLAAERDSDTPVLVAEVLDGQTIRLATGEIVRYIGLDVPLLQGSLGRPDPGACEALQANCRLVENRYVRLEADTEDRDRTGAQWRYVWVGSQCTNAELIRQGQAYHQPRSPNYRHSDWFRRLEKQAQRRKQGVWG